MSYQTNQKEGNNTITQRKRTIPEGMGKWNHRVREMEEKYRSDFKALLQKEERNPKKREQRAKMKKLLHNVLNANLGSVSGWKKSKLGGGGTGLGQRLAHVRPIQGGGRIDDSTRRTKNRFLASGEACPKVTSRNRNGEEGSLSEPEDKWEGGGFGVGRHTRGQSLEEASPLTMNNVDLGWIQTFI